MNKMYYNQYREEADGSKSWSQFGISGGQPMMPQAYPQPHVTYNDPMLVNEFYKLAYENARLHQGATVWWDCNHWTPGADGENHGLDV